MADSYFPPRWLVLVAMLVSQVVMLVTRRAEVGVSAVLMYLIIRELSLKELS